MVSGDFARAENDARNRPPSEAAKKAMAEGARAANAEAAGRMAKVRNFNRMNFTPDVFEAPPPDHAYEYEHDGAQNFTEDQDGKFSFTKNLDSQPGGIREQLWDFSKQASHLPADQLDNLQKHADKLMEVRTALEVAWDGLGGIIHGLSYVILGLGFFIDLSSPRTKCYNEVKKNIQLRRMELAHFAPVRSEVAKIFGVSELPKETADAVNLLMTKAPAKFQDFLKAAQTAAAAPFESGDNALKKFVDMNSTMTMEVIGEANDHGLSGDGDSPERKATGNLLRSLAQCSAKTFGNKQFVGDMRAAIGSNFTLDEKAAHEDDNAERTAKYWVAYSGMRANSGNNSERIPNEIQREAVAGQMNSMASAVEALPGSSTGVLRFGESGGDPSLVGVQATGMFVDASGAFNCVVGTANNRTQHFAVAKLEGVGTLAEGEKTWVHGALKAVWASQISTGVDSVLEGYIKGSEESGASGMPAHPPPEGLNVEAWKNKLEKFIEDRNQLTDLVVAKTLKGNTAGQVTLNDVAPTVATPAASAPAAIEPDATLVPIAPVAAGGVSSNENELFLAQIKSAVEGNEVVNPTLVREFAHRANLEKNESDSAKRHYISEEAFNIAIELIDPTKDLAKTHDARALLNNVLLPIADEGYKKVVEGSQRSRAARGRGMTNRMDSTKREGSVFSPKLRASTTSQSTIGGLTFKPRVLTGAHAPAASAPAAPAGGAGTGDAASIGGPDGSVDDDELDRIDLGGKTGEMTEHSAAAAAGVVAAATAPPIAPAVPAGGAGTGDVGASKKTRVHFGESKAQGPYNPGIISDRIDQMSDDDLKGILKANPGILMVTEGDGTPGSDRVIADRYWDAAGRYLNKEYEEGNLGTGVLHTHISKLACRLLDLKNDVPNSKKQDPLSNSHLRQRGEAPEKTDEEKAKAYFREVLKHWGQTDRAEDAIVHSLTPKQLSKIKKNMSGYVPAANLEEEVEDEGWLNDQANVYWNMAVDEAGEAGSWDLDSIRKLAVGLWRRNNPENASIGSKANAYAISNELHNIAYDMAEKLNLLTESGGAYDAKVAAEAPPAAAGATSKKPRSAMKGGRAGTS